MRGGSGVAVEPGKDPEITGNHEYENFKGWDPEAGRAPALIRTGRL
jgi:hypothetical protein